MNKSIKVRTFNSGKTYRLTTKLSNHNVAIIWFERDGVVLDGDSKFFDNKDNTNYNWWAVIYVGPVWKYLFSKDDKCYGTTDKPLAGLVACKQMLQYFIDNILKEHDVIEVSGSTLQRDKVYEQSLKSMGFRYTPCYEDAEKLMIFVKDSTPETIIDENGKCIANPENAWTQLSSYNVYFPGYSNFTKDSYDYRHLSFIERVIVSFLHDIWSFFKRVGMWVEYKMTGILFNITLLFGKKRKRHRHGVQN